MTNFLESSLKAQYWIKERILDLPEIYPEVDLPIDSSGLVKLYDYFNKLYFNNELPRNCKLYFSPLAKRVYGKARLRSHKNSSDNSYSIMLASIIQNDRKELIDTLLHEMIHIWQYVNYSNTGDKKFLDRTLFDDSGHGKTFNKWLTSLNAKGFNVTQTADVEAEIELADLAYALTISDDKSDKIVLLWAYHDFKEAIPSLIEELQDFIGTDFDSYDYLTSKDSTVIFGLRVTKQNKIPKGRVNFFLYNSIKELLLNSSLTTRVIAKNKKLETDKKEIEGIPSSILQILPNIHKYRGKTTFDSYLKTALYNTEDFQYLKKIPSKEAKRIIEEDLQPIKDYILEDWLNIAPAEIRRSNFFKDLWAETRFNILKKEPMNPQKVLNLYEYNFVDRDTGKASATKEEVKKEAYKFFESKIKADIKKSPKKYGSMDVKEIIDTVIFGFILKDTFLGK